MLNRLFLLLCLIVCAGYCSAESVESSVDVRELSINGQRYTDKRQTIGSPFVALELSYDLPDTQTLKQIRVYSKPSCSIVAEQSEITWCGDKGCRIGGQGDFDVTFESKGEFYHVFSPQAREIDISVGIETVDAYGAVLSQCKDVSLFLSPCDAILETQTRTKGDDNVIELSFVDSDTLRPIDDVSVLISSGPSPLMKRPSPGTVTIHTVPKKDQFKFSVSRGENHRFVVGPFAGQYVEGGLKKLKLALCAK